MKEWNSWGLHFWFCLCKSAIIWPKN